MSAAGLLHRPDGLLRAPLRLAVFVAALFVGGLAVQSFVYPLLDFLSSITHTRIIAYPWMMLGATIFATIVCLKFVDGQPWSAMSLGREALRPAALLRGALIGAAAIGVPSLTLLALGLLRAEPMAPGHAVTLAVGLLFYLAPAALWEELAFRGYPFGVLRQSLGDAGALVIASALFGIVHLNNPGANLQSTLIVMIAGVFLGSVLIATRSLFAAWFAHLAWNWTMAALLHSTVSGLTFETPGYRVIDAGPDWLTGGSWGPEGGAAAVCGMMLMVGWLYRRGVPGRQIARAQSAEAAQSGQHVSAGGAMPLANNLNEPDARSATAGRRE